MYCSPCIDEDNKRNRNKIGAKMKTLEAKPFDQNEENWKRENRLFHRPCSQPAPRGKIESVRTHSEVHVCQAHCGPGRLEKWRPRSVSWQPFEFLNRLATLSSTWCMPKTAKVCLPNASETLFWLGIRSSFVAIVIESMEDRGWPSMCLVERKETRVLARTSRQAHQEKD